MSVATLQTFPPSLTWRHRSRGHHGGNYRSNQVDIWPTTTLLGQANIWHCAHKYSPNCTMLGYSSGGGHGGKGEKTKHTAFYALSPPILLRILDPCLTNVKCNWLLSCIRAECSVHRPPLQGGGRLWQYQRTNAIFLNGKISTGLPTLDGCFSGWGININWINHRGCGPRSVGKTIWSKLTAQAAMEVVHIYWCWEEISLQRLIQVLR